MKKVVIFSLGQVLVLIVPMASAGLVKIIAIALKIVLLREVFKEGMQRRKAEKGFTLIELLVAIAIIGFLLTLGFVYYQDFNRRQIINQTARDLESNLRLAQSRALAGEKPQGWCDGEGETLAGYRLEFISEIDYQISAVCSNADIKLTKIVQLPDSVFSPSGTGVLFRVLAQGAETETSFILSGFGKEKRVIVEESGNINIE